MREFILATQTACHDKDLWTIKLIDFFIQTLTGVEQREVKGHRVQRLCRKLTKRSEHRFPFGTSGAHLWNVWICIAVLCCVFCFTTQFAAASSSNGKQYYTFLFKSIFIFDLFSSYCVTSYQKCSEILLELQSWDRPSTNTSTVLNIEVSYLSYSILCYFYCYSTNFKIKHCTFYATKLFTQL